MAFHNWTVPIPAPVSVRMLIDTGATRCVVKPSVFEALGLPPHDIAHINTPSSRQPIEVSAHLADLLFDDKHVLRDQRILAAPLDGQAIDGLLGRDALAYGVLSYRGIHSSWSLEVHPPPYAD